MKISENLKRLSIQLGLTQPEAGQHTKVSKFLIKHLKNIALTLGIESRTLLDSDISNTMAMHQIFQIFRKYDGYFDNYGNLTQTSHIKNGISTLKNQYFSP